MSRAKAQTRRDPESGSDLYDRVLKGWKRVERPHYAAGSLKRRTEVLWISPRAAKLAERTWLST